MRQSLQAIYFDIDDTLFSTTGFAEKARRASIARMVEMGLQVPEEFAYRELLEVISEFSSNYGAHYDKLLSRMPAEALVGTHPSLLVAGAVVAYHETKFRELTAYEDVTEALKLIHRHTNLRLGIISSGLRIKQAEKIVRTGVWRYVDPRAIFITDEVGIGKPNPKLYWRACAAIDAEPGRTMYVGDHPVQDIDGANRAGMISVWHHRDGRHLGVKGETEADHRIYNFLDLLDVLQTHYGFDFDIEL
jgi:putative hydrolase of the HAD superfamily